MDLSLRLRPRAWEWGLVILLFLVLRMGGLALFHPFYANVCPLEEYYRGTLGREILHGLSMPYWAYRPDDFAGGALVIGVLAAGFFKLFGSSAFVLKTIPVLISLSALLIWFGILYREFSRKCAWYFALFWIFAPSTFQSWSLVPLGDHYETMLISAIAVWVFLKLQKFETRSTKSETNSKLEISNLKPVIHPVSNFGFRISDLQCRYFFAFTLGTVCGFGVWFAYIFALTVMALLILWFHKNPRFLFTAAFWIFALGFVIGFSPWIFLNLQTGFQGLNVHDRFILWHFYPFGTLIRWQNHFVEIVGFLPMFLARSWNPSLWEEFVLRDFFYVFNHPALEFNLPKTFINWVYMALLILPSITGFFLKLQEAYPKQNILSKKTSPITAYFLIYAILHCLAMQMTSFMGERFMMPLMPAVFFGWALLMTYLEKFSLALTRASRLFFVVPMLGLGCFLWISMLSPNYFGMLLKTPGYAYDYVSSIPACKQPDSKELCAYQKVFDQVPPDGQKGIWKNFAMSLAEQVMHTREISTLLSEVHFPDRESLASFYFHLGQFSYEEGNGQLKAALAILEQLIPPHESEFKIAVLGLMHRFSNDELRILQLAAGDFPEELMAGYYRALGKQAARYWWQAGVPLEDIHRRINAAFEGAEQKVHREHFITGMGSLYTRKTYRHPTLGMQTFFKMSESFSEEDRKSFYYGVGRTYEISYLFDPVSCETWSYEYLPEIKDLQVRSWIQEGRSQVRKVVLDFVKASSNPVSAVTG